MSSGVVPTSLSVTIVILRNDDLDVGGLVPLAERDFEKIAYFDEEGVVASTAKGCLGMLRIVETMVGEERALPNWILFGGQIAKSGAAGMSSVECNQHAHHRFNDMWEEWYVLTCPTPVDWELTESESMQHSILLDDNAHEMGQHKVRFETFVQAANGNHPHAMYPVCPCNVDKGMIHNVWNPMTRPDWIKPVVRRAVHLSYVLHMGLGCAEIRVHDFKTVGEHQVDSLCSHFLVIHDCGYQTFNVDCSGNVVTQVQIPHPLNTMFQNRQSNQQFRVVSEKTVCDNRTRLDMSHAAMGVRRSLLSMSIIFDCNGKSRFALILHPKAPACMAWGNACKEGDVSGDHFVLESKLTGPRANNQSGQGMVCNRACSAVETEQSIGPSPPFLAFVEAKMQKEVVLRGPQNYKPPP